MIEGRHDTGSPGSTESGLQPMKSMAGGSGGAVTTIVAVSPSQPSSLQAVSEIAWAPSSANAVASVVPELGLRAEDAAAGYVVSEVGRLGIGHAVYDPDWSRICACM